MFRLTFWPTLYASTTLSTAVNYTLFSYKYGRLDWFVHIVCLRNNIHECVLHDHSLGVGVIFRLSRTLYTDYAFVFRG